MQSHNLFYQSAFFEWGGFGGFFVFFEVDTLRRLVPVVLGDRFLLVR
jgi:hypothetical protein